MKKCKNCESELFGKYCSRCGQNSELDKLSFSLLLKNGFYNFFSLESKFFKTFIEMFKSPRLVCSNYLSGKRRAYVNPVNYFLLSSSILFFVLIYLLDFDLAKVSTEITKNVTETDSNINEAKKVIAVQKILSPWIKEHFRSFNFGLYFFFPFFLKLFFYKRFRLIELIIFSLFTISQINYLSVAENLVIHSIIGTKAVLIGVFVKIIFLFYCSLSFFNTEKIKTFIKTLIALCLSTLAFFIVLICIFFVTHSDKILEATKATSN